MGTLVGGIVGAGIGYGTQVAANMRAGMDLRQALTTDIDAGKIVRGAFVGAMAGTLIASGVGLVATGVTAAAAGATAGGVATGVATAALSDDGGAAEVQATRTVIADTNLVWGRVVETGKAVVTPATIEELAQHNRLGTAAGFAQVSYEAQPGFAQAQAYFNRLLPSAGGKAADVYNVATAAMANGTFLTGDKRTIFEPLALAIKQGLVAGVLSGNRLVVEVPSIGQVIVELIGGN